MLPHAPTKVNSSRGILKPTAARDARENTYPRVGAIWYTYFRELTMGNRGLVHGVRICLSLPTPYMLGIIEIFSQ